MDAIESGIVKVPRIPVDDDAAGEQLVYLRPVGHDRAAAAEARRSKDVDLGAAGLGPARDARGRAAQPVPQLRAAVTPLRARARRARRAAAGAHRRLPEHGRLEARLRLDRRPRGRARRRHDASSCPATCRCSATSTTARGSTRQRTILVDSAQLESGEPLTADFKKAAAHEIEAFKHEYRAAQPRRRRRQAHRRGPAARGDEHRSARRASSASTIRCVVSVSMLTEGWDANTVTHILGIRPFRSQLLCEQVVGRGLRRRSYARQRGRAASSPSTPRSTACRSRSSPATRPCPRPSRRRGRRRGARAATSGGDLAIAFPKLDGYRVELPDEPLHADFDERLAAARRPGARSRCGSRTGASSAQRRAVDLDDIRDARAQQVAFAIAKTLVSARSSSPRTAASRSRGCSRSSSTICRRWLDECVTTDAGRHRRAICCSPRPSARAAEKVFGSIVRHPGSRAAVLLPIIRRFDPDGLHRRRPLPHPQGRDGSAADEVARSTTSCSTALKGNSWEEGLAELLEHDDRVSRPT